MQQRGVQWFGAEVEAIQEYLSFHNLQDTVPRYGSLKASPKPEQNMRFETNAVRLKMLEAK